MIDSDKLQVLIEDFKTFGTYRLKRLTSELPPEEIAQAINGAEDVNAAHIFLILDPEKAVKVFEYLDYEIQSELLDSFHVEQIANLLNEISPDDRTALFERLPEETQKKWLNLLSDEERAVTVSLLRYPEDSVGRLMTPDYISVKPHWTIEQVLDHVRKYGKDSETINVIYVTNKNGILVDDIRIRRILLAPKDQKVEDLMDSRYVSLNARQDQEETIETFKANNRVALPVTDFDGLLLGIVTIDDLLNVIEEEDTEDIQKFGGSEALDEPYMNLPFFNMIKKRAGWLTILFIGEMLTATAMGYFENEIASAVVLAMFVPLIISSGGNTGSQSATIIIRALAVGEVGISDWWSIMKREILSGLALGAILGVIGFLRISLWSVFSNIYGPHWLLVAFTVSLALLGVVLWGTFTGSMLPIILKKLNFDPAASSAPFVATLVDVTGLIIYFTVASVILKGTLL